MDVVIGAIVAIATGIAVMEGYAWSDALAGKLLRRAVKHIVDDEQARFEEEWSSDLQAMPNSIFKIAYALANFRKSTAAKINAEYVAEALDQLDDLVNDTAICFKRTSEKLERVRSSLQGTISYGDPVLDQKQEDIAGQFNNLEQAYQKYGFCVERMVELSKNAADAAARANSSRAVKRWANQLHLELDELTKLFKATAIARDKE